MKKSNMTIITLLVTMFAVTGCKNKNQEVQNQMPKVNVAEVSEKVTNGEMTLSGAIEADNIIPLSFSVPERVEKVYVNDGQYVSKGQLIASLETTDYQNALTIADAACAQAEDMYKRLSEVHDKNGLAEKDFVDIKTKYAQAKANKSIAANRLANTKLYAPVSGIIMGKKIEKGVMVSAGLPVVMLVKTDIIYAKVTVPETEIGAIKQNQKALINIPTINKSVTGTVKIINPVADPVTKTYTVKIAINGADKAILPGMIAEAKIELNSKEVVTIIPISAVVKDKEDANCVFVVDASSNIVTLRRIKVGTFSDREIVVQGGLQKGEKIVVAGQTKLRDGEKVKIEG